MTTKHREKSASSRVRTLAFGALATLATLWVLVLWGRTEGVNRTEAVTAGDAWHGRVLTWEDGADARDGARRCSPDGKVCGRLAPGTEVGAGSLLLTGTVGRVAIELADGSRVSLDTNTEFTLDAAAARSARLERGRVVLELTPAESPARVAFPGGTLESIGAKLALIVDAGGTAVDVSRGEVRLIDDGGRAARVGAGEEGRLSPGTEPFATPARALSDAIAWSEPDPISDSAESVPLRGLGELRAKKPGTKDELSGAVRLASHSVKVRIVDGMARTEIVEEFENTTDTTLEGIFRFPLPATARIERLALEVDGHWEEGAFVDRERAARIWRGAITNAAPKSPKPIEEIVWVPGPWRDPALLEWQRGGRFELRIYPIPKRARRRVALAYTEVLARTGDIRRYTYPLSHDPGGSVNAPHFSIDLELRGHDAKAPIRVRGYAAQTESNPNHARVTLEARDFTPSGDFGVDFAARDSGSELSAWAYQPDARDIVAAEGAAQAGKAPPADPDAGQAYVALALRPQLPLGATTVRRHVAIVVDSSRSMFGDRYERAARLAGHVARELDRRDRVTVLACDSTCERLPSGLLEPGPDAERAIHAFLEPLTPGGGSDVTGAIRAALAAVATDAEGASRVLYIGDGTPTVGAVRPAFIRAELRDSVGGRATVSTVGLGSDSDAGTLTAVAHAGGGTFLPDAPGATDAELVYSALTALYGEALANVSVTLPDGLTHVAPTAIAPIMPGEERLLVARMTSPHVSGSVTLRGTLAGRPFERVYDLDATATTDSGNAFVPRLFGALHIDELALDGAAEARDRSVALSTRYSVASPHTSLLVLESPAMFKAFGLSNTRVAPAWTGESDAIDGADEGKDEAGFGPGDDGSFSADALGSLGTGSGAAGVAAPRAMAPARAPSPKAKPRSMTAGLDLEGGAGEMERSAPSPEPFPDLRGSSRSTKEEKSQRPAELARRRLPPPPLPRGRRMIPMRKIWERTGNIVFPPRQPKAGNAEAIARAEADYARQPLGRTELAALYHAYRLAERHADAERMAVAWVERDPLDPDALTALADLAAERGERDSAIRMLASIVDIRPDDHKAAWRLARLLRWAARPEAACRYSIAAAQIRTDDAPLAIEAIRCARATDQWAIADLLLSTLSSKAKAVVQSGLTGPEATTTLSGDLKVVAEWEGVGADLDLSLLHPDGHRVSWLGAPTRSIITAEDAVGTRREGLALRGAKPGEYLVQLSRATAGEGIVRGRVTLDIAGKRRELPFVLEGQRTTLALVTIAMRSKLVPL